MNARRLTIVLILSIWGQIPPPSPVCAEELPTSIDTLDGYYHRDMMGVGHFSDCYVAPELQSRLAAFEGRFIRLHGTDAQQLFNPGPVWIKAIEKIETLTQPPLKLQITTRPAPLIPGQPFDLLVHITHVVSQPAAPSVSFTPDILFANFLQPGQVTASDPDQPSVACFGYTPRQLALETCGGQCDERVWPFPSGRPNLLAVLPHVRIELRPGESWTTVVHMPPPAAHTDGEAYFTGRFLIAEESPYNGDRTVLPVDAWQSISVQSAPPAATHTAALLRLADAKWSHTRREGWSEMRLKIQPADQHPVRVPVMAAKSDDSVFADTYAAIGTLQAFAADGSAVELDAQRILRLPPDSRARLKLAGLPSGGCDIAAQFRKQSRFAPPITKLQAAFLTEQGVQTLLIVSDYDDSDVAPATPFGAVMDGVKLRIRPAAATFSASDPLTFHAQAANTSGKPVCWWTSFNGDGESAMLLIDGKPLPPPAATTRYIRGWANPHLVNQPVEWTLTLPSSVTLAKGPHTLRYMIQSSHGTYINSNNQPIDLLKGDVASNDAAFVVE